MYKELLARLRIFAEYHAKIACEKGLKSVEADVLYRAAEAIKKLTAERDAAVADIPKSCETCGRSSMHNGTGKLCPLFGADCDWMWRGSQGGDKK